MTKNEFTTQLNKLLGGLPQEDIERSITFYSEMIDDSVEDGMNEEEAVEALGDIEDIVINIKSENTGKTEKTTEIGYEAENMSVKPKKGRISKERLIAVIATFPFWIGIVAGLFGVYIGLWGVFAGLCGAAIGFAVGAVGGLIVSPVLFVSSVYTGLMLVGCCFMLGGLVLPLILALKMIAKGLVELFKLAIKGVKALLITKEA